ncbi:hypothetical protein ABT160_13240 [Streptomyces sp. NPDC001941]|uniref:hypothetical protein n=1 Tax=Streptomyces sp. NPDC001941 TaxID=3154659 RepID=UPI003318033B
MPLTGPPPAPPLWFRTPPGFHDLAAVSREALGDVLDELAGVLPDDPASTERVRREGEALLGLLAALREAGAAYAALGWHPDQADGVSTSLLSLTVVGGSAPTGRATAARAALDIARCPMWSESDRRLFDLPDGTACALVSGRPAPPPGDVPGRAGAAREPAPLFQARAVVPYPSGPHAAVLDLTSTSVRHSEAYTDILEAIACTISFTDPEPGPADTRPGRTGATRSSRILEALG